MMARIGSLPLLESLTEDFTIEPKLDGIRCIAVCDSNGCRLFNRQLKDITARFPEVAVAPAARNCILDGELVCLEGAMQQSINNPFMQIWLDIVTRTNFQVMQRRANRDIDIEAEAAAHPARFMPFDVVYLNGANLCGMDLYSRRRWLNSLELPYTVPWMHPLQVKPGIGEGIMIKNLTSLYQPGLRSDAWRKVKWDREEYFYVCGYTPGNGKRENNFGALLVGSWEGVPGTEITPAGGDGPIYTAVTFKYRGEVGTGYTDPQLEELTSACQRLLILGSDVHKIFGFTLQEEAPRNASFVQPSIQIKVRFNEYTNAGRLRFPRYIGDCFIHNNG